MQPDREQLALSDVERANWFKLIGGETRRDGLAHRARQIISSTLDEVADEGGWCACEGHVASLQVLLNLVWREPR